MSGRGDLSEAEVPRQWTHVVALNADRVAALKESGHITERQEAKEGRDARGGEGSGPTPMPPPPRVPPQCRVTRSIARQTPAAAAPQCAPSFLDNQQRVDCVRRDLAELRLQHVEPAQDAIVRIDVPVFPRHD